MIKVHQVMSHNPVTVRPGTPVRTALRLLATHRITEMPVVDRRGRILGVVGEVDLMESRPHTDIDQAMRRTTVLAHPETDLYEVSHILRNTRVKSLPVVDAADQVVGMVSRSDIVRMLARDDDLLQQEIVDALDAAGLRGWRVEVHNAVVDLVPPTDGEDGSLACRTAENTLGVAMVRMA